MGIRTSVDLSLQAGRNNDLSQLAFEGSLAQVLDTLEHEQSGTLTLDPAESNVSLPFGDVAQARIVYIEADGPLRVAPGGGAATSATLDGAGGSYPTGFTGTGENLDLEIDGIAVSVSFLAGDQSIAQVIARINAAAALAGVEAGGVPVTIARNNGAGQLRLFSSSTGTSSVVEVLASSAAAVLTALGLSATSVVGANPTPGQTPITLLKPASVSGSDEAAEVKIYFLATLVTAALVIENLDADNPTQVTYFIAGDLLTSPPSSC